MNNIEVIGISGKAGSGKDHMGKFVLRAAGYHQWAIAWTMKMLALGRGVTYEEAFVTKPPAVRALLQQIGTEQGWMVYGKNYWLDITTGWLKTLQENLGISKFYFTDIRFPHEVEFIHGMGGKVVRLELGNRLGGLSGEAALHSSETAVDGYAGFDLTFTNSLEKTPWDFRQALEGAGILPRWDDQLEVGHDIPAVPFKQNIDGTWIGSE